MGNLITGPIDRASWKLYPEKMAMCNILTPRYINVLLLMGLYVRGVCLTPVGQVSQSHTGMPSVGFHVCFVCLFHLLKIICAIFMLCLLCNKHGPDILWFAQLCLAR